MKKYFHLLWALPLLMLSSACEKEVIEPPVDDPDEWTITKPSFKLGDQALLFNLENDLETTIEWDAAVPSEDYLVSYTLDLMLEGSDDVFQTYTPGNNGKDTSLKINGEEMDLALSQKAVEVGATVNGEFIVKALCMGRTVMDTLQTSITRKSSVELPEFDQIFITGTATEGGEDIATAVPMKRLKDAMGELTDQYEVYSTLNAGGSYQFITSTDASHYSFGGSENEGEIVLAGAELNVTETSQYRINFDMEAKTYSVFKVERLGLIGGPLLGWGEDVALDYEGMGVWKKSLSLSNAENMIIRLNNNWDDNANNVLKPVKGTLDIMNEGRANELGLEQEDFFSPGLGAYIITVDLSANGYSMTIEEDPDAGVPAPSALYLLKDGALFHEFVEDAEIPGIFRSSHYLALEEGASYELNSASDGSGTAYGVADLLLQGEGPDTYESKHKLTANGDAIEVELDQAYALEINFGLGEVKRKYHQMKLFHWDEGSETDGWWDKDEFIMTYVHPYTFEVTADLGAQFETKFFCPWEVEFGIGDNDDVAALEGSLTRKTDTDLANISNLQEEGTYKVTLVVKEDFSSATVKYVKQ